MTTRPLRLEYLPAEDLTENPANWRLHPPEQLDALGLALDEVGWAGALLYNEATGRLLDGHARRKLIAEKGGEVPVLIGSWDEATERKIIAVLDPIGGMAQTDSGKLTSLIGEVGGDGGSRIVERIAEMINPVDPVSEKVPLAKLQFHPQNYRKHPPAQLEELKRSIADNGFFRNVVVARDYTVLAGQGVIQAAHALNLTWIPVMKLNLDPNEPRALKVMAGDNEISRLADTDDRALTEMLKRILEVDDLGGTGFNPERLAALTFVTRPQNEIQDMDAAAEWVGLPAPDDAKRPLRVVVAFANEDDRARFMQLIGATVVNNRHPGVWSIYWPERPREQLLTLRFE